MEAAESFLQYSCNIVFQSESAMYTSKNGKSFPDSQISFKAEHSERNRPSAGMYSKGTMQHEIFVCVHQNSSKGSNARLSYPI